MEIQTDAIALESIKEKSRVVYSKAWKEFRDFFPDPSQFDTRRPQEAELLDYFRDLRLKKKRASSSMWTTYSMVNSVTKSKYGMSLQTFPRVTSLLKSYDCDVKKGRLIFLYFYFY
jgi:hypothetical protein